MRYSKAILDAGNCDAGNFRSQRYGVREEAYFKVVRGIRSIYPLNHLRYDSDAERALLEREHGWTYYGSKHGESRFTRYIQNYYLFVKHGIDYRRATSSSDVCSGRITREQALARLVAPPFATMDVPSETAYIADKLELDRAAFARILSAPRRWYFDYPNRRRRLGLIYGAYRVLQGKPKRVNF